MVLISLHTGATQNHNIGNKNEETYANLQSYFPSLLKTLNYVHSGDSLGTPADKQCIPQR